MILEKQNFYLNLLKKYFYWIIILAVLLVFIFGYFFLIRPEYEEMVKLKAGVDSSFYRVDYDKLSKLRDLVSSYNEIDPTLKSKLDFMLPEEFVPEELFSYLEAMVSYNGLVVKSIEIKDSANSSAKNTQAKFRIEKKKEPQNNIEDKHLGIIEIKLDITGANYASMKGLVKNIEQDLKLLDIRKLSFNPKSSTLEITLNTYYWKK